MLRIVFRNASDKDQYIFIPTARQPSSTLGGGGTLDHVLQAIDHCRQDENPKFDIVTNNNKDAEGKNPTAKHGLLFAVRGESFFVIQDDTDAANILQDDILFVESLANVPPDLKASPPLKSTGMSCCDGATTTTDAAAGTSISSTHSHGASRSTLMPTAEVSSLPLSCAPIIKLCDLLLVEKHNDVDNTSSLSPDAAMGKTTKTNPTKKASKLFSDQVETLLGHGHFFVDITDNKDLVDVWSGAHQISKDFFDLPVQLKSQVPMDAEFRTAGWHLMAVKRKEMLKVRATEKFFAQFDKTIHQKQQKSNLSCCDDDDDDDAKKNHNQQQHQLSILDRYMVLFRAYHKVGADVVCAFLTHLGMNVDAQLDANFFNLECFSKKSSSSSSSHSPFPAPPLTAQQEGLSSFLETFRYSPFVDLEGSGDSAVPCELHGDVGLVTVSQESTISQGLQIWEPLSASFVDVEGRVKKERVENKRVLLTCHWGDMLEFMTRRALLSTQHRVVMPPNAAEARYSLIVETIPHPLSLVPLVPEKKNDNDTMGLSTSSRQSSVMMTGAELYTMVSLGISSVNWY